jgi:hypothetical protein
MSRTLELLKLSAAAEPMSTESAYLAGRADASRGMPLFGHVPAMRWQKDYRWQIAYRLGHRRETREASPATESEKESA